MEHTTKQLPVPGESGQWEHWSLWARQSLQPSSELELLRATGQVNLFPELVDLIGVPQDPEWHPEGDVWIHTLHVCDMAAAVARRDQLDERETVILLLAALCHDFGKPATTEFRDGRWRASGHPQAGVPLTRGFLQGIDCPADIIAVVEPLVAEHLVHAQPVSNSRTVRRLIRRLRPATIPQLVRLIEADLRGARLCRAIFPGPSSPGVTAILERWETLPAENDAAVELPTPIIQGRHLIALGHQPSPWFGEILKQCLESQIRGEFEDEESAVDFLTGLLANDGVTSTEE